jgi:hypothetical protein
MRKPAVWQLAELQSAPAAATGDTMGIVSGHAEAWVVSGNATAWVVQKFPLAALSIEMSLPLASST